MNLDPIDCERCGGHACGGWVDCMCLLAEHHDDDCPAVDVVPRWVGPKAKPEEPRTHRLVNEHVPCNCEGPRLAVEASRARHAVDKAEAPATKPPQPEQLELFSPWPLHASCPRCGDRDREPHYSEGHGCGTYVMPCACYNPEAHLPGCAATGERGEVLDVGRCDCGHPRVRMEELRVRWVAAGWPWGKRRPPMPILDPEHMNLEVKRG